MAEYKISGDCKDSNDVITHYAFHTVSKDGISQATKKSKTQTIHLIGNDANSALTWIWNYKKSFWDKGEKVTVVNGSSGKYLRSNSDNKVTDNLEHLIDFDWIAP